MLKLKVKTTHKVTTEELEIFCDPPLTFEAVGNIGPQLWDELRDWSNERYPPEKAVDFVPKLFVSVSQNGDTYPLATPEQAKALEDAVGGEFLSDLVENYWGYEFSFFKKKRAASANSLKGSGDSKADELTP
jgi:hypothetical protein